jgi:N-acetylmuramoyl-L-alanine amidase
MKSEPDSPLATLWCPSPNCEDRRDGRAVDILLLHYTGMESAEGALDWLTREESRVSAHYLIDEDGRVTQMVDEAMRAWHAGLAHWAGEDDINSCSIGIEIHNTGPDFGYPDFPDAQMRGLEAICSDILKRHAIPPARVLAHSDVAPARKRDPGEKFDWRRLAKAGIGLWVEPAPLGSDAGLGEGDSGAEVEAVQQRLARYGYGLEISGLYDSATHLAVTAFQRHFRQARVDGRADLSTIDTLGRLIDRL